MGWQDAPLVSDPGQGLPDVLSLTGRAKQPSDVIEKAKRIKSGEDPPAVLGYGADKPPISATMQPPKSTPGGGTSAVGQPLDLLNSKPAPARGSGLTDAQIDIALPLIFQDESSNRNIPQNAYHNRPGEINPSTGTHTGPSDASGYPQYLSSTWRDQAPKAGVDINQYPTAISAPREVQERVTRFTLRTEGTSPWAPYNSTLRSHLIAAGIPVPDATYSGVNFKVAPSAVKSEQSRPDTSVVYMAPGEYLDLLKPLEDDGPTKRKRTLLDKSLNAGDEVESIPTLDVKTEKGNLKVVDQDGRNRAQAAIDAGVDLIPVAIRGAPPKFRDESGEEGDTRFNKIIGMTGQERPFDFQKVPKPGPRWDDAPVTRPTPWWMNTAETLNPAVGIGAGIAREVMGQKAENLPAALGATVAQVAIPQIESVVSGAVEGGQRAAGAGEAGQDPLRLLSPNTLAAAQTFGGMPMERGMSEPATTLAPGGRFSPLPAELPSPPPPPVMSPLEVSAAARPNALGNVTRERVGLAQEARQNFGIPIDATDLGRPNPLRDLPGSGEAAATANKVQSWQRAMSREMGDDSSLITDEVIQRTKAREGGTINRIENSHEVKLDIPFFRKMEEVRESTGAMVPAEAAPVERLVNNVMSLVAKQGKDKINQLAVDGYVMGGETYGDLLAKGGMLERATGSAVPAIRDSAQAIKSALQDALSRSLPADERQAYQTARYHYKVMKTLEPVARQSPVGLLNPSAVSSRVIRNFPASSPHRPVAMDRLAKIGQEFLAPKPLSAVGNVLRSTAARAGGGLAAGGAGIATVGALPTAAIGSALLGAGRITGNILRSQRYTEHLIDKVLNPRGSAELMEQAVQTLPATRNYLMRGRVRQQPIQMQAPQNFRPPQ